MNSKKHVIIKFDGASRGNPGPAAIGVVLTDEKGKTIQSFSKKIGTATNNQAEYRALIAGLEAAAGLGATSVEARSDSELVVKQIKGTYKVKHPHMKDLNVLARQLIARFEHFSIQWVPRELNTEPHEIMHR